jgi:hypothetical protein
VLVIQPFLAEFKFRMPIDFFFVLMDTAQNVDIHFSCMGSLISLTFADLQDGGQGFVYCGSHCC